MVRNSNRQFVLAGILTLLAGECCARPVAVTELFTSQGCQACKSANTNLIELAQRSNILALSFSVTYLDYLGWRDSNGQPAFTDRQAAYEPQLGYRIPFVPQVVINGSATSAGSDLSELSDLIARNALPQGPAITIEQGTVTIDKGIHPAEGTDVWVVSYDPGVEDVTVGTGDNAGRTVKNANLVRSLELLGHWSGEKISLSLPIPRQHGIQAILVQAIHGGPILAAQTEDLVN